MNILILSDSHGRSDLVREVMERTRPDLLLFCGDGLRDLLYCDLPCPLFAVKGNCDLMPPPLPYADGEVGDETLIPIDNMKLLLMHGHRYGVKGGLGAAIARAASCDADALIFGHTHQPFELILRPKEEENPHGNPLDVNLKKPLYVFNPGSLCDCPHTFGTLTLRGGVPLFGHGVV